MKKLWVWVGGLAAGLLVMTAWAADRTNSAAGGAAPNVAELQRQLEAMQKKMAGLEERLGKLEKRSNAPLAFKFIDRGNGAAVAHGLPSIQEEFAEAMRPPKIAGEGVFNGWKYYLIPLGYEAGK